MVSTSPSTQRRTHIIVGGTAGMGKAAAMQLLAEGEKVAIIGRYTARARAAADTIGALGFGSDSGGLEAAMHRAVEALGGIEYNGECWVGRFVMQRFATATGQTTNAVFLQVELSGFSRIGTNPLETLKRNIPGYSRLNQQAPSSNQTTDFFD